MDRISPKRRRRKVLGAAMGAVACLVVAAGIGAAVLALGAHEDVRDANWKFDDPVVEAVARGADAAEVEELAARESDAAGVAEMPDYGTAFDGDGNPYADKDLLVELDGAVDEAGLASLLENEGVRMTGASLVSKSLADDGVLVEVAYDGDRSPQELGAALAGAAPVRGVELNYLQEVCDVETDGAAAPEEDGDAEADGSSAPATNDTHLAQQWELEATGAFEAWDVAKSDRKVTVAVIDSGVLCNHEDLAANVVSAYAKNIPSGKTGPDAADDCMGHGTHVSGIIAAVANNGKGTAGVSYNANVLPVRAWKEAGKAKNSHVIAAIDYVTSLKNGSSWNTSAYGPIRVINMSLGGYSSSSNYQKAITRAHDAGILVVASAGNDSTADTHYPSAYDHVLAVSALEEDGGSGKFDSSYSNFGSYVDLAAPGSHVYATTFDGEYGYKTGTSMATPVVSGAAALVAATKPELSPDQIEEVLERTAEDKGASGWDEYYGHGALQLNEAVKSITPCTLISAVDVSGIDVGGYAYTGSAVKPALVLKHGGATLKEGVDYTLTYSDNVNAGTATITIKGRAKFTGARTVTFTIKPMSILGSGMNVAAIPDQVFTGQAQEPAPTVTFGGSWLRPGVDFDVVSFANNVNVGTAKVTLRGRGNFTGTRTATFAITPADMVDVVVGTIADQTYAGAAVSPDPDFLFSDRALVKGVDFEVVSYSGNVNVGQASVTVRGKGNFAGERTVGFEIIPAIISSVDVEVPDRAYTGFAQEPEPVVSFNGMPLVKGVDYEIVFWGDNVNVGTGSVIVRGRGNFAGERTDTFAIWSSDMTGVIVEPIPDRVYSGFAQEPEPVLSHNGIGLVEGTDYSILSYEGNVEVGTAIVTVQGMGGYSGECAVPFKIVPTGISGADAAAIPDRTFTGAAQEPEPELSFNGVPLVAGVDFEVVSFEDNVNVGTARVTVRGAGNFAGERTEEFVISREDLSSVDIAEIPGRVFSGAAQEPEPELSFNGVPLVAGVDFEVVSFQDNVNVGTAGVALRGAGNFAGERTVEFGIAAADIASVDVAAVPDQVFTGAEREPELKLTFNGLELVKDADYYLAYGNNVDVGTATITLWGKDNFTGERTVEFGIARIDISKAVAAAIPSRTFTGAAQEPDLALAYDGADLVPGVDYEVVRHEDNVNAGTAKIIVQGRGGFEGERAVEFEIAPASLSGAEIAAIPGRTFTGMAQEPEPAVSFGGAPLVAGVDFAVAFEDNVDAGTAKAVVKGAGNFAGERAVTFEIAPVDLADVAIAAIPDRVFTGLAQEPEPVLSFGGVELVRDDDYDVVSYEGNVSVGTARIVVKGLGNFAGERALAFTIVSNVPVFVPTNILRTTAAAIPARTFTGKAQKPEPVLSFGERTLVAGVDYDVIAFENNVNAGAARVIVRGKGDFTGCRAVSFTIKKAAQPMQLKAEKKSVAYAKVKGSKQVVKGAIKFAKKAQGSVSYARAAAGSSACLAVNKTSGAITVKKGTAPGTYKIKVKVTAAGNKNYAKGSKSVVVKVSVTRPTKKKAAGSAKLAAAAVRVGI